MNWFVLSLYLSGLFFFTVGTIGLIRLPDPLSRLHATTLTDTLGSTMTLAGAALHLAPQGAALKILLIWLVIIIINPATAHLVGQFAWYHHQEKQEEGRYLPW